MMNVVLDTNVLVAAVRSRFGASFRLVELVLQDTFLLHLSTPLLLEYEEILVRETTMPEGSRELLLTALLSKAQAHEIYFLFRGVLTDDDAMLLEIAIKAQATIVTHNIKDFTKAADYGVAVFQPKDFLHLLQTML
jgi:putative PIN family toxin of toxin-antitoxin system